MEYCAAEIKKELSPFALTSKDELETIMLSEMPGSERQISYDLTYKRKQMNKIN